MPPTTRLPPIGKLAATLETDIPPLFEALDYLFMLYHSDVRGSRRRRQHDHSPRANSDTHGSDDRDAFERAYAIRWLTALIAQLETRQERLSGLAAEAHLFPDAAAETDDLVQRAASLLAICAGVSAAGKVQRRFTLHSPLPSLGISKNHTREQVQIDVFLTDMPLDNHNHASVGAQTWGGACVLAEMIAERPDRFGLLGWGPNDSTRCGMTMETPDQGKDTILGRQPPLRILELGAGTGLVGLTVAKLLQTWSLRASPHSRSSGPTATVTHDHKTTVVLTDFYPAVLDNLQSNIDANFPSVSDQHDVTPLPVRIYSHLLDWSSFPAIFNSGMPPELLSAPFDIIFGADVVYEAQHAIWIRDCLTLLLSRPQSRSSPRLDGCTDNEGRNHAFHLVVPMRPTHAFESNTIEAVFGRGPDSDNAKSIRKLTILSKETIVCEAYGDERGRVDDDVEYAYYRIGWSS